MLELHKTSWLLQVSAVTLVASVLAGCSAKVPLRYDYPLAKLRAGGPTVGCRPVEDLRAEHDIDRALESSSLSAVDQAIRQEVANAEIAGAVVVSDRSQSAEDLKTAGISVLIEPALEEMVWEVSNYKTMLATTAVVSFLTGGIGGLAYTSTSTDVYGRTKLTIHMLDLRANREMTKTYQGSSRARMPKLESDQEKTMSRMAGESLLSVMEQFRADLVSFAGEGWSENAGTELAPANGAN